jgi:hypothetical protein
MAVTVNSDTIDRLLEQSFISITEIGQKTTVMLVRLPSGYEVTVSTSAASEEMQNQEEAEASLRKQVRARLYDFECYVACLVDKSQRDMELWREDMDAAARQRKADLPDVVTEEDVSKFGSSSERLAFLMAKEREPFQISKEKLAGWQDTIRRRLSR